MASRVSTSSTRRYLMVCFLLSILCCALTVTAVPQAARATGETVTVVIQGSNTPPGFSPALLTVHVYDTVVFVNHSSPAASYAVSTRDGSFSSPAIVPNQQWRVTFSSVGVHEFHAVSAPQRMVGEILVVDNTVSLLPTAVPAVNATVVALIQAGHVPPDNLLMATPTSAVKQTIKKTSTTLPLYLFIALAVAALLLLSALIYLLLRLRGYSIGRKSHAISEEEDQEDTTLPETTIPTRMGREKKRLPGPAVHAPGSNNAPLSRLRRVQAKDDEDDEDE